MGGLKELWQSRLRSFKIRSLRPYRLPMMGERTAVVVVVVVAIMAIACVAQEADSVVPEDPVLTEVQQATGTKRNIHVKVTSSHKARLPRYKGRRHGRKHGHRSVVVNHKHSRHSWGEGRTRVKILPTHKMHSSHGHMKGYGRSKGKRWSTVDSFHGRERVKVEDQRSAYPQSMSMPHEVHVRTKGHSRVKVTVPGFRSKHMYHRYRRHHDDGARVRVKVAEDLAKAKAPSYDGGPTSSVPEYKNWRDQFDAWQWRSAHDHGKTGRHYDDDDDDEDEGPATYLPLPANSTFKGSNSSDLTGEYDHGDGDGDGGDGDGDGGSSHSSHGKRAKATKKAKKAINKAKSANQKLKAAKAALAKAKHTLHKAKSAEAAAAAMPALEQTRLKRKVTKKVTKLSKKHAEGNEQESEAANAGKKDESLFEDENSAVKPAWERYEKQSP